MKSGSAQEEGARLAVANSVKEAFFEQLKPQPHSFAVVQRKDMHGRPPNGREAFD